MENKYGYSIIAAVVLAIMAMPSQALEIEGINKTVTHTCVAQEKVSVSGLGNVVNLTGACAGLSVEGNGHEVSGDIVAGRVSVTGTDNVLRIGLPPKTPVAVEGSGNDVQYRVSKPGAAPVVSSTGVNNRVRAQK